MSVDFVVGLLGLAAPEPAADPVEAMRLLRFHALEGLCAARSRVAPAPLLPQRFMEEVEPVYRARGLATTLVLESARRARATLSARAIPSVLFKGAALVADGTYADPGARRMDDADLLVPPERAAEAVEVLLNEGFRPVTGWSPATMGWADAVALLDATAPAGTLVALDLHWRTDYDRLRFGGDGRSVLWQGYDEAQGLPAPEAHLALAAEHFLKHLRFKVHLAAYGDLARLSAQVTDWDRVEALIGRSRLAHGLRALMSVLARDLGAPVPRPLADGVAGDLGAELAPAALVGRVRPVEGRLAGVAHRWRLLGSAGRIVEDLREAAFPPGAWLSARYGRAGFTAWMRYVADVSRWAVYRGRSPASPNQELFQPTSRD